MVNESIAKNTRSAGPSGRNMKGDARSRLADVIGEARRIGDIGARQALERLAVDRRNSHESMPKEQRILRRRLRAHGLQVGDRRDVKTGIQEIHRLAHEVAYEHWHRMLFARFLAENDLLIEPVSGVAVSLAECEELARERGRDMWAVTENFAERMLPRIFRPDDPTLEVTLAPETRQAFKQLIESLSAEVFTADDSLGWTYQFWQAEHKARVNASGVKIGADELPAVTQLFTERYMVLFLFHNTIGAWRAGKVLTERPELAAAATSEEDLRQAVRIDVHGGYDFSYLRFVRERQEGDSDEAPTGRWRPAAGEFTDWPSTAAELRILDPCCGSGHFLIEGLSLLVRLRMVEEQLALADAVKAVLRDNLYGLEIEPRCTQIAAFCLALAAWKMLGGASVLPPLNLACSGLAPNAAKQEWIALAGDSSLSEPLRGGLGAIYDLFEQAPELGSLIDPHRPHQESGLFQSDFESVRKLLSAISDREQTDETIAEHSVAAQGMVRAAELLAGRYTLVATNVPFLARGKQSGVIREFAEARHTTAKNDLATMFVSRVFGWLGNFGTQAVITPQSWWFLPRYKSFRGQLLCDRTWNLLARLGPGAFETVGGHVVNVALNVISAKEPVTDWRMSAIDASAPHSSRSVGAKEKARMLQSDRVLAFRQLDQAKNPDRRILFRPVPNLPLLSSRACSRTGTRTSDNPCLLLCFWEITDSSAWRLCQSTVRKTQLWGGCQRIMWFGKLLHELDSLGAASIQGEAAWGKPGILVSLMSDLPVTLYTGAIFDMNAGVVYLPDTGDIESVWAFLSSDEYCRQVCLIDQQLKRTTATLLKVPFDSHRWRTVAGDAYANGLPEPFSDDPTQWLFHGHPCGSVTWNERAMQTVNGTARSDGSVLQVAVARMLGYRWPAERDPGMRLADEQRAWVERCRELDDFADADGIVCLPALRGERQAAERLRGLLAAAYGDEWSSVTERRLLAGAAEDRKPARTLEEWLRDRFFIEHCKLFQHRPFVWHLWDGRKDGFHALVNYHRLTGADGEGRRTLSKLLYDYLDDWVVRQRAGQRERVEGADGRFAAAINFGAELEHILEGEPPFDLFIRWKPLHRQPIGWEPDIDDGIRTNIRPFMAAELRLGGRKGAGILRAKPNVKWAKDRGKEPESLRPRSEFPWFWSCPGTGPLDRRTDFLGDSEFDGNRWNDLHYSNDAKRAARVKAGVPKE